MGSVFWFIGAHGTRQLGSSIRFQLQQEAIAYISHLYHIIIINRKVIIHLSRL